MHTYVYTYMLKKTDFNQSMELVLYRHLRGGTEKNHKKQKSQLHAEMWIRSSWNTEYEF